MSIKIFLKLMVLGRRRGGSDQLYGSAKVKLNNLDSFWSKGRVLHFRVFTSEPGCSIMVDVDFRTLPN